MSLICHEKRLDNTPRPLPCLLRQATKYVQYILAYVYRLRLCTRYTINCNNPLPSEFVVKYPKKYTDTGLAP